MILTINMQVQIYFSVILLEYFGFVLIYIVEEEKRHIQ